jgi:hypothetical protein
LPQFASSLFNSGHETGVDIHGRPFGDWFLYQGGMLNWANEHLDDSNKGKVVYGMIRFDYACRIILDTVYEAVRQAVLHELGEKTA